MTVRVTGGVNAEISGQGRYLFWQDDAARARFTIAVTQGLLQDQHMVSIGIAGPSANVPGPGVYPIDEHDDDGKWSGVYIHRVNQADAAFHLMGGTMTITESSADHLAGTFTATGVSTCAGAVAPTGCPDWGKRTVTLTGTFSGRPPSR